MSAYVVERDYGVLIGISGAVGEVVILPLDAVLRRWSLARHQKSVTTMLDIKH